MKNPGVSLGSGSSAGRRMQSLTPLRVSLGLLWLLSCVLGGDLTTKAEVVGEHYVFSTFAGAAAAESANSLVSAVSFSSPTGLAVDNSGNVYVADTDNHAIRKIAPTGVVTLLAGVEGKPGSADGLRSAARFYYPSGVAVDNSGNVYVADTANHTIRRITADGVVTTLAGLAGCIGNTDGAGNVARFYYPYGVATDRAGNVYVADTFNSIIRLITPADMVKTFAGLAGTPGSVDGRGGAARFNYPSGVATDSTNHIDVADAGNHSIRQITLDGKVTTLAGSPGRPGSADGIRGAAQFSYPNGVAADAAGNIFIADTANQTVRKITLDGVVTTLAGRPGVIGSLDGAGSAARFNHPVGLAVDGASNVYVADTYNHSIRLGQPTAYHGYARDLLDGATIGHSRSDSDPNGNTHADRGDIRGR
ncbi:MAG: hypothetical protein DME60_11705 [Verrucomicrobia bacterium]|nr:MAG: hypothetical protein DME60_11705 [Verrucomicrobiota bacterium]